jgi:hypothetical protein
VVDYFSKFPLVVALPDKSASSVVNILKSLYAIYGVPMATISRSTVVQFNRLQRHGDSGW